MGRIRANIQPGAGRRKRRTDYVLGRGANGVEIMRKYRERKQKGLGWRKLQSSQRR